MIYKTKEITLKDGRTAIFRAPEICDAKDLMEMFIGVCGESDYLVNTAEQARAKLSVEGEEKFIQSSRERENVYYVLCTVDGEFAGNCEIMRKSPEKFAHRGYVAIALRERFWGLGIASKMFDEMIQIARDWDLSQLELDVFDQNERAVRLYERKGFKVCGRVPDAARLPDGRVMDDLTMVLKL